MQYIFCLGMYRSSSTWQYEVVSHMAETYRNGVRLGFIEGIHFQALPGQEHAPERVRVLKTHDVHPLFIRELNAGNALPIYSYRDMRDVAFSFMHKAGLTFDEMIEQKFLDKVLANDAYWRAQPRLVCQKYETVITDEIGAVAELSRAIGLDLPVVDLARIAQDYSWDANLRRTREVKERAQAAGLNLDDKAHIFEHDPHTLLHWNHLREGKRKSWRELATPAQRATLAATCGEWLMANGYEAGESWVADPFSSAVRHESRTVRIDHEAAASHPTLGSKSFGLASPLG